MPWPIQLLEYQIWVEGGLIINKLLPPSRHWQVYDCGNRNGVSIRAFHLLQYYILNTEYRILNTENQQWSEYQSVPLLQLQYWIPKTNSGVCIRAFHLLQLQYWILNTENWKATVECVSECSTFYKADLTSGQSCADTQVSTYAMFHLYQHFRKQRKYWFKPF